MIANFRVWLGHSVAIAVLWVNGQGALGPGVAMPHSQMTSTRSESIITMLDSLELLTWQLVSYRTADGTIVEAVSDRPATFQFQGNQISGTTGCNRFFATYAQQGNTLTFREAGSTQMACLAQTLVAQEQAILNGLTHVVSYAQTGDQLTLLDSEGTALFTLVPQASAALTNTEWLLTSYHNGQDALVSPLDGTTITAMFNEQGLRGSAGCNDYQAAYEVDRNTLTLGAAASTRRFCGEPSGVMRQEVAYLALLQDVATYEISGNQLELKDARGTTLAQFTTLHSWP